MIYIMNQSAICQEFLHGNVSRARLIIIRQNRPHPERLTIHFNCHILTWLWRDYFMLYSPVKIRLGLT